MRGFRRFVYWLFAPALCVILYWPGFRAWFEQDDFAWLSLKRSIPVLGGLVQALFAPLAQGTFRPLSERIFFLAGYQLFGTWATPFHGVVFVTQVGAVLLATALALRLTRSRLTGFLAPVFWVANTGLIVTLSWLSAYNQVLCAFFLLAAFYAMLRHAETGARLWLVLEWAAFVGGLGALETMIVYPALAAAWALLFDRKYLRRTVPFFAAAVFYAIVHYRLWPYSSDDPSYVLHFRSGLFATLGAYWTSALGLAQLATFFPGIPAPVLRAGTLLLSLGVLGYAGYAWKRGNRIPVFGLIWFLVTLAPVLPLRDHVSSYYLTLPAIGLALAGASATSAALQSARKRPAAELALLLPLMYLVCGSVEARLGSTVIRDRSFQTRTLVLGAYRAHQLHPNQALVFANVDQLLFASAFLHNPFPLWDIPEVYIDPQSVARIGPHPNWPRLSEFALDGSRFRRALEEGQVAVYQIDGGRLRGRALTYLAQADQWPRIESSRVDVGKILSAGYLGSSWYTPETGTRWMPGVASLKIAGPRSPEARLFLEGWCPPQQVASGPLRLDLAADGIPLKNVILLNAAGAFRASARLPAELVDRPLIEIVVAVNRTFRTPGDRRELGLVFGSFEVR